MAEGFLSIDVRDTVKDVIADIGVIRDGIGKKAAVRAVNRAVDGVATGASREVRKIYNVKARVIAAAMKKIKASQRASSIFGSVHFSGRNIALIEFAARAVNPWNVPGRKRAPGGGASVQIRLDTGRKLITGAFITTTRSGVTGVFRRVGRGRNDIRQLRSVSIPDTIRNQVVRDALLEIGTERFKTEFIHQMDFLTKGQNGG